MFGNRRRRAASNPPINGSNANPAAATAATSAFLRSQASNASLSSAAAAAALRSRPTSPTSVADVQTKRTLRRAGSNSSAGSSVNGSQRGNAPPLQRRGSSGSMTERTFRDPSPARGVPSAPDAPPVPEIPHSHRRATSLEAPGMRIASPPPTQSGGRGSSLGPGTSAPRKSAQRTSNLSSVSELTKEESRGSVNFSYPTNSRPQSPISQKRLTSPSPLRNNSPRITSPANQNLVYDPNTRSFLPAPQVHAIQQRIYEAANKPTKKKKKVPVIATGSHLADGTMGSRPRGTAIDAMEAASQAPPPITSMAPPVQKQVEKPNEKVAEKKVGQRLLDQPKLQLVAPAVEASTESASPAPVPKKKKKVRVVASDSESDQASYVPNSSDNDSDFPSYNTRAGALLAKKPSIVREDREREEQEDDTPNREQPQLLIVDTSPAGRDISPSPLPRSSASRTQRNGQASSSAAFAQEKQHVRSVSHDTPLRDTTSDGNGLSPNGSAKPARVQSVSPGRIAHFAPSPDNLVVKHQPPPRSISPRKSALKHSNSRTSSPIPTGSEASNNSVSLEEQLSGQKKRSVRVSFDETNVVVGQAASSLASDSPIVQSPQTGKRPWYSIGRGKKKDLAVADDEEDEIMKPRPALPSFGSVRERKNRDIEERPLVKPSESTESRPALFTSPTGEAFENSVGQSNDHAVGAVFSQDFAIKNAANISKSREPLPPQVTSVEGSGYSSDTDSSLLDTETNTPIPVLDPEPVEEPLEPEAADIEKGVAEIPSQEREDTPTPTQERSVNGNVPEIAISQPTPTLDEVDLKRQWPSIPGEWESSTDSASIDTPRVSTEEVVESTPAHVGIAEPTPDVQVHGSPKIEVEHLHNHSIIAEETEESDADIYSDAAEDLTDSEGDGFQSLNAVVESPITKPVLGLALPMPPDSPTTISTKQRAYNKSGLSKKGSEPDLNESWEKAQEYWKSLSDDKKRQLELEAMQEAEEGSDTEVEAKPAPKPKKKKKPQPSSEPVHAPTTVSNDRTYMIQPGAKAGPDGHSSMRSSMRTDPPPAIDTTMRKSMRNRDAAPAQGSMRNSMRGQPEPRGSLQKKIRPASLPSQPLDHNAAVKQHLRNLSSASAAAASDAAQRDMRPKAPALRRKGSGDSDSSFKRAKPSNEMNFRRSMRGSNPPPYVERAQSPTSRFSMRSLSPTGSMVKRPFNSTPTNNSGQSHMRMSMRGNQAPAPTLRNNTPNRTKSPSGGMRMPGFGRSSKPAKGAKASQARSSRFADSSDEDEERPAFRSRILDSSDDSDNEPVQKATAMPRSMRSAATAPSLASKPVRAIPKQNGVEDGDSSELPDSDDEKATSPGLKLHKKRGQNGSMSVGGTQGVTLASGSLRRSGSGRGTLNSPATAPTGDPLRPAHKRRGSFMSILRRKKDNTSKVRKSDAESPARRDTPLERSKIDRQALRNTPASPKLQKRNPLSRENSNQWPLAIPASPPRIVGVEEDRPFTADAADGVVGGETLVNTNGNATPERPDVSRRFTATGLGAVDSKAVNGTAAAEGRKKKKFGALRRMFRLDD